MWSHKNFLTWSQKDFMWSHFCADKPHKENIAIYRKIGSYNRQNANKSVLVGMGQHPAYSKNN